LKILNQRLERASIRILSVAAAHVVGPKSGWLGRFRPASSRPSLEHVAEKLIDFSDQNMLHLFDFEHLLLARVIQPERKML
jgi:hypothetical protein